LLPLEISHLLCHRFLELDESFLEVCEERLNLVTYLLLSLFALRLKFGLGYTQLDVRVQPAEVALSLMREVLEIEEVLAYHFGGLQELLCTL